MEKFPVSDTELENLNEEITREKLEAEKVWSLLMLRLQVKYTSDMNNPFS